MRAVDPGDAGSGPRPDADDGRLRDRELLERREPLLASEAAPAEAAVRERHAGADAPVVDEHLAGAQPRRDAQGAVDVLRPDGGGQVVAGAVRDLDDAVLVLDPGLLTNLVGAAVTLGGAVGGTARWVSFRSSIGMGAKPRPVSQSRRPRRAVTVETGSNLRRSMRDRAAWGSFT